MRHLIALGLSLGIAVPAVAQTEVIIRRPGVKDQVIHLDSSRTGALTFKWDSNSFKWDSFPLAFKWDSNLIRSQARLFKDQARTLEEQLSKLHMDSTLSQLSRIRLDSLTVQKLALRSRQSADEMKGAMAQMEREMGRMRRQPHLGVVIETAPRASDNYGAYISAVTPGSPAEKAGIMAGDIITRIGGQAVVSKSARSDDRSESAPGVKLISLIAALKPGKEVEVDLRRGTQTRTVKVTPTEDDGEFTIMSAPTVTSIYRGDGNGVGVGVGGGEAMAPRAWSTTTAPRVALSEMPMQAQGFALGGGMGSGTFYLSGTNSLFGNLELAAMNDKLGAYFGTDEGVLVVNTVAVRQPFVIRGRTTLRADSIEVTGKAAAAPTRVRADTVDNQGNRIYQSKTNTLGLEPGDVIVSVDGRKVTTPSQLMRIVATYDHGDEFKLQIMRQKHAESIPVKMP